MNEEDYFKNLTNRERAIFEGGISMGALFHQFVGTPINLNSLHSLEKAIEESIMLQPKVIDVAVNIDKSLVKKACGTMGYTSLTGEMLNITITTKIEEITITTCISYDEKLDYPIMYVKE